MLSVYAVPILQRQWVGQMRKPWAESELAIVRERFPVDTAQEIARRIDRSVSAIYQAARSLGLRKEVFKQPSRLGERKQGAIADYIAGMSNSALEAKYGVKSPAITRFVRAFDPAKVKGTGRKATDLTREQEDEVVRLYADGISQDRIGKTLGISQGAVSLVLKRRGARTGHQSGERSPLWQGGRSINRDGYVRIWLSEDDPLSVMADTRSYALEHRVVLARHLGRSLDRHETVHHINGDRSDNRLENLQLRNGHHGSGVRHRCRDCGSNNIESTRI